MISKYFILNHLNFYPDLTGYFISVNENLVPPVAKAKNLRIT